jgi:hypothetical protein
MLNKIDLLSLYWLTMKLIDTIWYSFFSQSLLNLHFIFISLKISKWSKGRWIFHLLEILIKNILFKQKIVLLLIRPNFDSTFNSSNISLLNNLFWFNISCTRPFFYSSTWSRFFHILRYISLKYFQYLWLRITYIYWSLPYILWSYCYYLWRSYLRGHALLFLLYLFSTYFCFWFTLSISFKIEVRLILYYRNRNTNNSNLDRGELGQ